MKNKKGIFIFILIISVISSYFLFKFGITNKLLGTVSGINITDYSYQNSELYPSIDLVINSTGEKLVNEEASITVYASSNYKITKFLYSLDKKNYKEFDFYYDGDKYIGKLDFLGTFNSDINIKVENEQKYSSYVYTTKINVDKQKPMIEYNIKNNNIHIYAKDNLKLSSIQCSLDGYNYNDNIIDEKNILMIFKKESCNYIRTVDKAGNISEVKKITD